MRGQFLKVMRHPALEWMAVAVLILGLVVGGMFYISEVAQAGSNGQMLKVGNACENPATLTWVRIRGKNQDGRFATWESWPNKPVVKTDGWWWIGRVVIEWRTNRDNGLHSTAVNVPKRYERDDYRVLLDRWGC